MPFRRPLDLARLRNSMVERQLAARGISDKRVLEAFRLVAREDFVAESDRGHAYNDHPLAIGHGQTISQPYMVALMLEELHLTGSEKVLEIGTGSGYQTALLAEMAAEIHTIERVPELAESARKRLEDMAYENVQFRTGDGTLGWPEAAPFDCITVGAGAPHVPQALTDQLAEAGRLVIPVGANYHQQLVIAQKRQGKIIETTSCPCVFVKLIGEDGWA